MEETRRAVILDEIEQWRVEGLLDYDEYVFMRSRYDQGRDAALDGAVLAFHPPSDIPSVAAYATHLLGGLLLGAGLIALVQFFIPIGAAQPLAALAGGLACLLAAWFAEVRRGELVAEAGFAAALVVAGSVPFYALSIPLAGLLAAGLAVFVTLARRGNTPLTMLATATFFVGAQYAARVDLFTPRAGAAEGVLLLALVGFAGLLAVHRHARWGGLALGLQAIAIALAGFPLLDAIGVTDPGLAALAVGLTSGALFAAALQLEARAMVATTSAMLTLAAISFAFLALGPALAAMVLLLLGALLVWQAETVKGYFAPAMQMRSA